MNVHRYRFALIAILLLLVDPMATARAPKGWQPQIDPHTRKILNLPFTVITKGILITNFFCCSQDKKPAPPISDTGGYTCSAVYDVGFIGGGNTVAVAGNSMRVPQGACIRWHVDWTDGSPANFDAIDFINTPGEVVAGSGKTKTPQDIGDYCRGAQSCVMYVSIPVGKYFYNALVRHHGFVKKADPDVDVACSGPNCDEL